MEKIPLIVILGPTAVGKTSLSIKLAEQMNGEIISADSRLFYRGMDIGTAKPTAAELERVPHHLISVSDPDQTWSLAKYLRVVPEIVRDIHQRGKLAFLVGGTGQYIRAVVEGWKIPEVKPDPRFRKVIERWADEVGVDGIRRRLEEIDPVSARDIDGPNLRRMIRALEVTLRSGIPFSEQRGKQGSDFAVFQVGLERPREELYRRIDRRIQHMLDQGFKEEVQRLLELGYAPDLPALSAIGYKQIIYFLEGVITLDEAVRQIASRSRKYVRQQSNWFQEDDPRIHWYQAGDSPLNEIKNDIQHFLDHICYTEYS